MRATPTTARRPPEPPARARGTPGLLGGGGRLLAVAAVRPDGAVQIARAAGHLGRVRGVGFSDRAGSAAVDWPPDEVIRATVGDVD